MRVDLPNFVRKFLHHESSVLMCKTQLQACFIVLLLTNSVLLLGREVLPIAEAHVWLASWCHMPQACVMECKTLKKACFLAAVSPYEGLPGRPMVLQAQAASGLALTQRSL